MLYVDLVHRCHVTAGLTIRMGDTFRYRVGTVSWGDTYRFLGNTVCFHRPCRNRVETVSMVYPNRVDTYRNRVETVSFVGRILPGCSFIIQQQQPPKTSNIISYHSNRLHLSLYHSIYIHSLYPCLWTEPPAVPETPRSIP